MSNLDKVGMHENVSLFFWLLPRHGADRDKLALFRPLKALIECRATFILTPFKAVTHYFWKAVRTEFKTPRSKSRLKLEFRCRAASAVN